MLPTVIHRGYTQINTLTDAKCGSCELRAYIGTTAQIQEFISSPKSHIPSKPVV